MEELKTVRDHITVELIEKKSRFIADLYRVNKEEEAQQIIKQIKKQYYDARHHCFAYQIKQNEGDILRFSDDGEPSGTAGAPILNIITKNNLKNVLLIVTRYFGGILLGTGGLVRAYSGAAQKAIEQAQIIEEQEGYEIKTIISYSELEKFKYYCKINQIQVTNIEYLDNCWITTEMSLKEYDKIIAKTQELPFEIIQNTIIRKKYVEKNTRK